MRNWVPGPGKKPLSSWAWCRDEKTEWKMNPTHHNSLAKWELLGLEIHRLHRTACQWSWACWAWSPRRGLVAMVESRDLRCSTFQRWRSSCSGAECQLWKYHLGWSLNFFWSWNHITRHRQGIIDWAHAVAYAAKIGRQLLILDEPGWYFQSRVTTIDNQHGQWLPIGDNHGKSWINDWYDHS